MNPGIRRRDRTAAEARGATEEQIRAIEDKYAEKELAEKKRMKFVKYADAVSSGSLAIVKAWTAGPILGPIMAAITAAAVAMQLATIKAQPYYSGGILKKGKVGFFEGARDELITPLRGAGSFMDFARSELLPALAVAPPTGPSGPTPIIYEDNRSYPGTFLGNDIEGLRQWDRTTRKRATQINEALEGVS